MAKQRRTARSDRTTGLTRRQLAVQGLLIGKSLDAALRISCTLSCFSHFRPEFSEYWVPTHVHYPKTRLFALRVLGSRAQHGAGRIFRIEDIRDLLNACTDDMHDPHALDRLKEASGTSSAVLEFQRFMAVMGNIQIAHVESDSRLWVARTIGLLSRLPVEERSKIPDDRRAVVDEVLREIPQRLGADVEHLGLFHFWLTLYYQDFFFQHIVRQLAPDHERDPVKLLSFLFNAALHFADQEEPIEVPLPRLSSDVPVDAYLALFARTVDELNAEDTGPQYQGHPSSRLTVLDRFPVVRLPRASIIIPELTVFAKTFPFVIDFSLLGLLDQRKYNEYRGTIQELFLRCLVEDRLPQCLVIPERKYGREEVSGPDLAIVEGDRLIVIESKARRLSPAVVTRMSDDAIDQNLEDAYAALLRLPQKIAHLYEGRDVYSDIQPAVDRTRGTDPICVVVIGGSALLLSELVRQRAAEPSSPLHGYQYPFCVVSLERFENAVEIARAESLSLAALLDEHAETAAKADPNTPMADMWGGRKAPAYQDRYVSRFIRSD